MRDWKSWENIPAPLRRKRTRYRYPSYNTLDISEDPTAEDKYLGFPFKECKDCVFRRVSKCSFMANIMDERTNIFFSIKANKYNYKSEVLNKMHKNSVKCGMRKKDAMFYSVFR